MVAGLGGAIRRSRNVLSEGTILLLPGLGEPPLPTPSPGMLSILGSSHFSVHSLFAFSWPPLFDLNFFIYFSAAQQLQELTWPCCRAGCPCAVPWCHTRGWTLLPSSLPVSSSGMLVQNKQQDPNFLHNPQYWGFAVLSVKVALSIVVRVGSRSTLSRDEPPH